MLYCMHYVLSTSTYSIFLSALSSSITSFILRKIDHFALMTISINDRYGYELIKDTHIHVRYVLESSLKYVWAILYQMMYMY